MNRGAEGDTRGFNPILRTKLHRPQLTAGLVQRDRLLKVLGRVHETPLTLVSAPAGYGKSVLVAQWAEQPDSHAAWLSLDAGDSDLRVFLDYFVAAVDTASPGACEPTRDLLAGGPLPPLPVVARHLLNDLDAMPAPCALVLDDYHLIAPVSPVHDLMLRMLEHPPRQFRFVVLTRQDPPLDLPSLRAGHRVNELRLQSLRFTGSETSEFLSKAGGPALSEETLAQLEHGVEGWAAGLRLVSLTLRHVDDPLASLEQLEGRLSQSQEYLLREVLAAQEAGVRERLLASSILDRFCEELLQALAEPAGSADDHGGTASDFLAGLQRDNLFTISLDPQGKWFRYHHLFQGLLENELRERHGAEHVSALHLRASQWFEGEGLIEEALKHGLAAGDIERAVQIVARHRHVALDADQWYTLAKWLALIPETTVEQHPALLLARGWIYLNHDFHAERLPSLMERVEALLGTGPREHELRGELALCRAYLLWFTGDGAECLVHLDVALEHIPCSHSEVRSHAEMLFAFASQMVGRKEDGLRFLDDLLAQADSLDDLRRSRLVAGCVFVHVMDADLVQAEMANRRLSRIVERGEFMHGRVWASLLQGQIHLRRCEWEAAVAELGRAVAKRSILNRRAAVDSILSLMFAQQALGQEDEVAATTELLRDYVASLEDAGMEGMAISGETRLALFQGRRAAAERWLETTAPPPDTNLSWWFELPSFSRCQAEIAVGSPDRIAQAETRLREYAAASESQHDICQLIWLLALLAMAFEKQGKTEEGLGVLERAVTMARKGDVFLPFVELGAPMVDLLNGLTGEREFVVRVERLVAALGAPTDRSTAPEAGKHAMQGLEERRVAAGAGNGGLTHRELDVLELLARRLQNKEIADRLSISDQTVGSHLKQIYQKLGVHGRRKAVERAVETGILDSHPPS